MKLTRTLAILATRAALRANAVGRRRLGLDRTVYVGQRTAEYRRFWEEGARLLDASFEALEEGIWEVGRDGVSTRITNYITEIDERPIRWKAGDKVHCYQLARESGFPVPSHVVLDLASLDAAKAFLASQTGPFVLKPAYGSSSALGVTTGIHTWNQVFRAAVLASLYHPRFLLERLIPGESWRVLVLDGRMIHAVRRRGVRLRGDGRSTVAELLAMQPPPRPAEDWILRWTLAAQGLTMATVPPAGDDILARSLPLLERRTRELRTVYTETVTDQVGPAVAEKCGKIARMLGSKFAGVDLIATDLRRPLEETGGVFLEINTTPGIHHHYQSPEDHRDPVAAKVLAFLLHQAPANASGSR